MITPSEFIMFTLPGSPVHYVPGTIIEINNENEPANYTPEKFEAFVAKHYEYTKKPYPGEIYFTLGEYKTPVI